MERVEGGEVPPAQRGALRHLGDDADLGVAGVPAGDEQHARLAADFGGDRHRHAGKRHGIVQGNQFKGSSHASEVTPNT